MAHLHYITASAPSAAADAVINTLDMQRPVVVGVTGFSVLRPKVRDRVYHPGGAQLPALAFVRKAACLSLLLLCGCCCEAAIA